MPKKKFTKDSFPDSWKNMYAEVRNKAIEIANALLRNEDMDEFRAIPIATRQAEEWAKKRGKTVFKKNKD